MPSEGVAVPATAQEIFERYVWAGPVSRDPVAVAELFTPDGVLEAPLVPAGHDFPRQLAGREEIRDGLAGYYRRSAGDDRKVNFDRSRYVVHTTADPDVFIAEIDTVLDGPAGAETMSLVQIFRLDGGKITLMRDYFSVDQLG
jgi:limonene-1,2-epoxide hydrolase